MTKKLNLSAKLQLIALKHRGAIFVSQKEINEHKSFTPGKLFSAFLLKLKELGYTLDIENTIVKSLMLSGSVTPATLSDIVEAVKQITVIPEDRIILYPNFPEEVENTSDLELFLDALIYALSDFEIRPEANPEFDRVIEDYKSAKDLTKLTVVSDIHLLDLFWNLASSPKALSESEIEDMKTLMDYFSKRLVDEAEPKEIVFKEIMAILAIEFTKRIIPTDVILKTPTDLLRVLQYMEEEKSDLKGKFKMPKFSSEIKTMITDIITKLPYNPEDIMRYKEEWKHIFRYVKIKNSKVEKYIEYLYRHKKLETFNSKENVLYANFKESRSKVDLKELLAHLSTRPSEMLRRVDKLVRTAIAPFVVVDICVLVDKQPLIDLIIESMKENILLSENRIVYQLYNHLATRSESRGVFVKGRIQYLENLPELDADILNQLRTAILLALLEKFKQSENPVVYVRDNANILMSTPVQTSNRMNSENYQSLIPGSRIKFDTEYIRLFTHWGKELHDVDMSVALFKDDDRTHLFCSFANLNPANFIVHSGDVRRGPGLECVDIDIKEAVSSGYRYAVQSVNYWSGGNALRGTSNGLAFIDKINRQKGRAVIKPDEVLVSNNLTCESTRATTFVVDLVNKELVWVDAVSGQGNGTHVSESVNKIGLDAVRALNADVLTVGTVLGLMALAGKVVLNNDDPIDESLNVEEIILTESKGDGTYVIKHDVISDLIF